LKNPVLVKEFSQAPSVLAKGKTLVSGGMIPGITTDAVSVLFAELLGARRLVNISHAGGVFDSDPRKNPNAKLLRRMSHEKLVRMAAKADSRRARENFVFDLVAAKLSARSRIPLLFVSATDLRELEKTLEGKRFFGTVVG